ncbi:MAG TPA: FHA domain-containing protein [Steroidobacteraceae bacterium]|nr:FHA domain-containing protein [Steroidobacteraceae bacterium]
MTKRLSRLESLLFELKRRKVFQVGSVYAVAAWGASVGAADLLPAFGAPDWSVRAFVISAILGFPIAVALAWVFEITPKGVVRDETDEALMPLDARRAMTAATTRVGGAGADYVLVRWNDGRGTHERRFDHAFRIGRDADCDLRFDDPLISRHHADIARQDELWWLRDLGSRNGTLLDGHAVESAPLPPRCEIQVADGGPRLVLELHAAPSSTTVASGHFRQIPRSTIRR